MRHYELFYIIPGKYTEGEMEEISINVKDLVKKSGGEITVADNLGDSRLAYEIGGSQSGSFMIIEFNSEPDKIKELDNSLKMVKEVLRYQITGKKQESKEEAEKKKIHQERILKKAEEEKYVPPPKVNLEELDKKLGEILSGDII